MDIPYEIIRSRRKTVSLQITPQGQVVVRCPNRMPRREVEAFVKSKQAWLQKHLTKLEAHPQLPLFSPEDIRTLADRAAADIPERVRKLAPLVGVRYGRITIRNQHTRWGSCSAQGNLNFNCLLMLCPEAVRDYVVIHELCHRLELNHSEKFWTEVERVMPDYKIHRKWLKDNGTSLIARLP